MSRPAAVSIAARALRKTYGPTNKKAYELGTIDAAYAKRLPSYPENAARQLPIDLDWYAKFEAQAATAYQNMLSE